MRESHTVRAPASNDRGRKNAPKNIGTPRERITFRDLARLASRKKTPHFLVARTGADLSTAKRWLSGRSRPPAGAVYAVLGDIFERLE